MAENSIRFSAIFYLRKFESGRSLLSQALDQFKAVFCF